MSFNGLLLQIVLISSVALLFQGKRIAPGLRAIALSNLIVLGVGYGIAPERAGWISGLYWATSLLWPVLILFRLNRLIQGERYRQAARLAQRWRCLKFMGGYLQCPDFLRGLDLAQQGETQAALDLISHYRHRSGAMGQNAAVLYYRLTAQWSEFLYWVELNFTEADLFESASALAIAYVRAQGEVGNLNRLLETFERFRRSGPLSRDRAALNSLRAMVLAFCGRKPAVQHLFEHQLSTASLATQRFWLATATLAQGDRPAGQVQLEALAQESDGLLKVAIAHRLAQATPGNPAQLGATSLAILNQLETEVLGEVSLGDAGHHRGSGGKLLATYSLVGINVAIFLSQSAAVFLSTALVGGDRGVASPSLTLLGNWAYNYALGLITLGPLIPAAVLAGDWWRLVSAVFLHAGFVHLAANMVGLFYYGSFVESQLGRGKFLWIYAVTGIGSMVGMMGVALLQNQPNLVGVGASGAVMGLLGTMLVVLLRSWQRSKSAIAASHFRVLVVLVFLQTAMDFLMPQVSQSAHLTGLAIGIGLGLLLHHPKATKPKATKLS